MLTIKAELWPFGDEENAKRLVTINLANMGKSYTDDCTGHDYVWTVDEPEPLYGEPISESGTLKNYNRKASCVDMLDAILTNLKYRGGQPHMTKYELNLAEKLRNKTS